MKKIIEMIRFKTKNLAILMIALFGIACARTIKVTAVFAAEQIEESSTETKEFDVMEMPYDLFGDIEVESVDYLYNFDDSPDYIYVVYENHGYAIYLRENLAVLEYSVNGTLPFSSGIEKKYYAGPQNYYEKVNDQFINNASGEVIPTRVASQQVISDEIRNHLVESISTDVTNTKLDADINQIRVNELSHEKMEKTSGKFDGSNPTHSYAPGTAGTTYITNYQYFYKQKIFMI